MSRILDRPVFIIAMPRSGSTLLFDVLRAHEGVRAWDNEAYAPWAAVDPTVGSGPRGDAFDPEALDGDAWRRAEWSLHEGVMGTGWFERRGRVRYRLLEKTPPNVLRVAALDKMFPDALFIYLTRDAPPSIASMLEGRDRGLAVREWPRKHGHEWHFLMAPGWLGHLDDSPAEQFAWQWRVGNQTAVDDLARIAGSRWCRIKYEDFIADAPRMVEDLLTFCYLDPSPAVTKAARELAVTPVSLSAPSDDKWQTRAKEITPALAPLKHLRKTLGYKP
ncbi:MAG TPA: sulfotransferase [Acidimicrobiales bacterium]|nr:sulfotransferase [Acidimicrobiales bacterium]